jgi:thiamine-phosphate pyrophosphorylase
LKICLVTDRRRLAPRDAPLDASRRCLVAQARYAADAGIDIIQVRERDLEAADLASLVADFLAVTTGTATRVVVNDRLDVALACAADGVHLRGDSIAVEAARRLAPPGFLIGRSVHTVADAAQTAGADYVIAGTLFPSASTSAGKTLLGLDGLRAIAAEVGVPVLAIGGISEDRVEPVAAAGAGGVAAIGLFMTPEPVAGDIDRSSCRAMPLVGVVERIRARFDRAPRGSLIT